MCRSQAQGGRRCPGRRRTAGHTGDGGQESYQGTSWQGYEEAMQRADEINRRVYDGETVEDIMSDGIMRRAQDRIAQITKEGW